MKAFTVLQLGQLVEDTATELEGMLTHMLIDADQQIEYVFQPRALHTKTGSPITAIFITTSRVRKTSDLQYDNVDIPVELIGKTLTDRGTGYTGVVIGFTIHMGNCVHVELKALGVSEETGELKSSHEFDIRRLEGDALEAMPQKELKESIAKTPSPTAKPAKAMSGQQIIRHHFGL